MWIEILKENPSRSTKPRDRYKRVKIAPKRR